MFLTCKREIPTWKWGSVCRNPLKSGQCFLHEDRAVFPDLEEVAIPSNRVNVSYCLQGRIQKNHQSVAIPSNRVNVSYLVQLPNWKYPICIKVAIPSNRVNVSYTEHQNKLKKALKKASQSPQIGSMFLTKELKAQLESFLGFPVAIPSNRVNVSYMRIGQCFLI